MTTPTLSHSTYSAPTGLTFDGLNLSLNACPEGQFLKTIGGVYACTTDADTTYSAGTGLVLSSGNVFSLNISNCTAAQGNKLTYEEGSGFVCAPDVDTNTDAQVLSWNNGTRTLSLTNGGSVAIGDTDTTYTADPSLGIVMDGTTLGLRTCGDGEVLKFTIPSGQPGEWVCAADNNTAVDLSGYLQVANLEAAITMLNTPGYYNKSEIDSLISSVSAVMPSGGLKVPVTIDNESDLPSDLTTYEEGYQWYIGDMDITDPDHTGRAWVYDDNGTKRIFKTIDQYLSPDTSSIVTDAGGRLTVSTAWLASQFSGYAAKSELPVCSASEHLTYNGTAFACTADKDTVTLDTDTTYTAGNGLVLSGNTFAINASTCTGTANKLTYDAATGFTCEADQIVGNGALQTLTYVSGTGTLSISDGNSITLDRTQAGNGLRLDGNVMSANIPAACASTQKLSWTGTGFECKEDMTSPPSVCYATGDIQYLARTENRYEDPFSGEIWYRLNGQVISADGVEDTGTVTSYATPLTLSKPFVTNSSYTAKGISIKSSIAEDNGNYLAWKVFDGIAGVESSQNGFSSGKTGTGPWYLEISFPSAQRLESYQLKGALYQKTYDIFGWEIQGSNDGGQWTTIDSHAQHVSSSPNPTNSDVRSISSSESYKYFRLNVTDYTANRRGLSEWVMNFADNGPYGYKLVSQAASPDGQPYLKVGGECMEQHKLESGTTDGHVLMWNGSKWIESGAISIDTLTANAITTGTIKTDYITDSTGSQGAPGQTLTIDVDGKIRWQ